MKITKSKNKYKLLKQNCFGIFQYSKFNAATKFKYMFSKIQTYRNLNYEKRMQNEIKYK